MTDRFFVKVYASGGSELARLQEFDLDLFHPTARVEAETAVIEGLVTLTDVERLVRSGYRVLVEEESSKRARARDVVQLEQWLKERRKAR